MERGKVSRMLRKLLEPYAQWNWAWTADAAVRYNTVIEEISRHAGLDDPLKICDVGCGSRGGITAYLTKPAVGVDLTFVPAVIRRFPLCTPVAASAGELPFTSGTFDIVVCLDVLEHVPANGRQQLLTEMFRIARPDGLVLVGAPCGQDVREAEVQANALFRARTGRDHPWLVEHLQNDPLDFEHLQTQITQIAKTYMEHCDVVALPNMSLTQWKYLRRMLWSQPIAIHFQRLLLQPWFAWLKKRNGPPSYRWIWSVRASKQRTA